MGSPFDPLSLRPALGQAIPEALGFIETSVTHLDHLIEDMLDVARLDSRTLHYAPLDMQALVQGALRTLAHQMPLHRLGPNGLRYLTRNLSLCLCRASVVCRP